MAEVLRIRRGCEKSKITRIRSFVTNNLLGTADVTVEGYQTRLDELISAYAAFNLRHDDLAAFIDPDNADDEEKLHTEYFVPVEELFLELKTKLVRNIASMTASVSMNETTADVTVADSTIQSAIRTQSLEIRLPPLTLPSFSGDYSDWTSFFDIFSSSVNANINLSEAQKLQYLKSSLKGEAFALIQHFTITNANYAEAWGKLKARFGKQKQIIHSHIQKFLDQPAITNLSSANIRQLTNTSDEVIRALKAINCNSRDPWLIYIMLSKMDHDSKQLWFRTSVKAECPTLEEFFTFLEERCDALESFHPIPLSSNPSNHTILQHHQQHLQNHLLHHIQIKEIQPARTIQSTTTNLQVH